MDCAEMKWVAVNHERKDEKFKFVLNDLSVAFPFQME